MYVSLAFRNEILFWIIWQGTVSISDVGFLSDFNLTLCPRVSLHGVVWLPPRTILTHMTYILVYENLVSGPQKI